MKLAADVGKKCTVFAGYNERFYAVEISKCDVRRGVVPRSIEVVVEPKCVSDVVKHVKKNWGGKTKTEKAW